MKSFFDTPILFLIFNRPDTTQLVFNQIQLSKPKYLYVAADGHRLNVEGEKQKCEQVRNIIKNVDWDCEVKTLFRDRNLGCGKAVSSAITWFFEQVEYGIILEDDCLPDLSFFPYCATLLEKYKTDEQVMLIGGNNFQNGILRGGASYYFSGYPHIWGWASWRRAWQQYDFEMKHIDSFLDSGINEVFSSSSEKRYWKKLLPKVFQGKINTWDYQWVYSIWNKRGYSITPNCNLVINLGFRNASTHTFLHDSYKENLKCETMLFPLEHPIKKLDREADLATFNNVYGYSFKRLFRLLRENNLFSLMKYYLKL